MTPITVAGAQGDLSALRIAPERYELLAILGQGAMGIVYQARDRELDRVVAIKTILPGSASGADFEAIAARLSQEAQAAARLSHPGIVTVHDVGHVAGAPYVVMEYFTGRTLAEVLEAGPLPPVKTVQVVLQVCRALEYAHAQGVVHRDIKSSNIMVDARWNAKLTDFGVARIVDKPANEAGMMIGTPAYMSPEQVRGGATDARSELFSVGVVLYEALTGTKPFPGDDVASVLHQVVHLDPVPPREQNFAVSPALDAVVRRAMSKDPEDRYRSAAEFADALTQAVTIDEAGTLRTLWHHARHRRGALVAAGLAVAGLGAVLSLAGLVHDEPAATVQAVAHREAPAVPAEAPRPRPAAAPQPTRVPAAPESGRAPSAPESARAASAPDRDRAPAPPESARAPAGARAPAAPESARAVAAVATAAPPAAPAGARPPAAAARPPAAADSDAPPPGAKPGCLSVNAVPFATVFVDGRSVGDTPQACVRVPAGRRRVHFQWTGERSPEHVVVIDGRHTSDNPLRVSYDFRARRFVSHAD